MRSAASRPLETLNAEKLVDSCRTFTANARIYQKRRETESILANYLHVVANDGAAGGLSLNRLADCLSTCRCTGVFGMREDGKPVVIWDRKCESNLLCPDEINEERLRIEARYLPALLAHQKNGLRIYKAVLTWPNAPRGELRSERKKMYAKFSRLLKQVRGGGRVFSEIVGAQVVDEVPLSRRQDWNLHLNVLFVVNGFLSFDKLKKFWGYQLDIQSPQEMRELARERLKRRQADAEPTDEQILRFAFSEILKYPAKMVAKLSTLQDPKHTHAPALNEWPAWAFCEWYEAHQRHRRMRSYGVLFRLGAPPEDPPGGIIEWLGRIEYNGRRYRIILPWLDLKPLGDKYAAESEENSTGPPLDPEIVAALREFQP